MQRFAFLTYESDAALADVRARTSQCSAGHPRVTVPLYEQLVLHAPFRECSPTELRAAISGGWRERVDGPFHVRGCRITWYVASDACSLLQDAGTLRLYGDSLVRHLRQAIFTILIGGYANATDVRALTKAGVEGAHPCTCDEAYDDGHRGDDNDAFRRPANKFCREASVGQVVWSLPTLRALVPSFCPMWRRMHLTWTEAEGVASITYTSGGLHAAALDERAFSGTFGGTMLTAAQRPRRPTADGNLTARPASYLCGFMHAPGVAKKPAKYLKSHGMAATVAFNARIMARACPLPIDAIVDHFAVTHNATSIDGQHYYQEANILLAQLLLNTVAAMARADADASDAAEAAVAVRATRLR